MDGTMVDQEKGRQIASIAIHTEGASPSHLYWIKFKGLDLVSPKGGNIWVLSVKRVFFLLKG